jgi:tape measure domain-containing protein
MPNVSLPGAGLVKEVGDQFGYAAQQVLLFGTTYKALAFLTDFPSKVGEAVAQLQSFRNTLQAITPNADEFQKSNQFILDTVDKYNIPIQSARDGFTKLYASMEPAGFSGEQIQKLFLGISKASATLGLSSDKVDRVTYAFSQMASKGQLMSEEVTGQLGDVIPGALSIMAKAANMDIKTFKKAMEDGVFVGKAFTDVMSNVPIVLEQRFGKGAEGAAKTFQGQMNAMATATKMLYESFVPVGDLFTSKIVAPFTNGLQVLTEGFNAFFSGAATKTAGGSALFQELEKLRPTFKGIADNIKQLLPVLQSFATTLLGLGKILLQVVSNSFVGYLARVYLAVLPLTMAIQALNLQALIPMIGSLLRAIPAFIAFSTAAWNGASRTVALRIAMQATGQTATITGGQVALLSNTLKTAFVGTVVGAVVIGIGMIIERIMTLSSKMEEAKGNALRLQDSIKGMSKTELQVEENKLGRQGALLQGLQREASGQRYALLNKQQEEMVMNLAPGSITRVAKARNGLVEVASGLKAIGGGMPAIEATMLPAIEQKIKSLRQNIDSARLTLNASDQNASLNLAPITSAGGDEKSARAAASALASRQALADKLSADQTKTNIERQKTEFENEKSMINMAYDLREARANSFQKETIRFQRELFNIEMERQKAVLDANSAVTKAQGAVAGGTTGATGLLQGSTGISSGAHFDVRRQDGGYITPQQARALFETSVAKQLQLTSSYGPRKAPTAGASTFHRGVDLAGPANTPLNLAQGYSMVGAGMKGGLGYTASVRGPQGEMYDVGHLQQPRAGVPSGKVTARQKRVALADQQTENALQDTKVKTTLAEAEALKKAEIAMVNYISSIAPVAEQDLQNQLLGKRIELMQSGVPEAFAETQMKIFEAQEKVRMAGEELDLTNQKQVEAYEKLKQSLPGYIALLEDAAVKQQQLGFTKTMKDLGDRAAMARALTPEAEMRTRLQQQGYAGAQLETLFETEKATTKAEQLKTQMQGVASTISDAFSTAFQGIINGSMSAQDALGNFFQSVGQSFVKMAMDIIAKQMVMIVLGFLMKALGLTSGGGKGGLSDLNAPQSINNPLGIPAAANGAIFSNGIAKFATGGIVNGPTLFPFADGGAMQMGLMGEAGPEAIMPLQRGPDGSLGVRAAMGGNGMGGSSSPILNMSFETSTINGVEYVSRDQLEAAMMQTRRQASSDGAKRGMAMTLDKIQQSPQTRRRIGM